jgi:hypothetical protein
MGSFRKDSFGSIEGGEFCYLGFPWLLLKTKFHGLGLEIKTVSRFCFYYFKVKEDD